MKVTIDLDADRYRAIKVEAARTDRSVRDSWTRRLRLGSMPTRRGRIWRPPRRRSPNTVVTGARRPSLLRNARRRDAVGVRFRRGVTEGRYRVELAPAAQRQLRRLPPGDAARLRGPIRASRSRLDRRARSSSRHADFWRLRVGELRIIYLIDDDRSPGRCSEGRPSIGKHVPADRAVPVRAPIHGRPSETAEGPLGVAASARR